MLGGVGAGGNATVTLATLSQFDNHEREKYIGWLEGAFGLGFILGPLLGAILYNVGGYKTAYFTFFGMYIIVVPFILPKISQSLDLLAQD